MDSIKTTELSELLVMIRSGARADEAFSELLERYTPLIRGRVSAYFGSLGNLSEPMQEASIALHSAALTYDSEKCDGVTFGLYAGICISNRLKTLLRSSARVSLKTEHIAEPEKISSGVDLESSIATRDLCERVMKLARAVLSDFEFEVFRMGFERYTTKDIAEALGRESKAVDNAKFRISKRLRETKEICNILLDI